MAVESVQIINNSFTLESSYSLMSTLTIDIFIFRTLTQPVKEMLLNLCSVSLCENNF